MAIDSWVSIPGSRKTGFGVIETREQVAMLTYVTSGIIQPTR